jgi:hypothetical protein
MDKTRAIKHIKLGVNCTLSSPTAHVALGPSSGSPQRRVRWGLLLHAALAPVVRQGCVNLCVRPGRGLSSARGSAEAEAPEMPIDLGTR